MSALKEGERQVEESKTLGRCGAVSPEIKCASKQGLQSDTFTSWKGELLGRGVETSPAPTSTLIPARGASFTALGFAHLTQFHQPQPPPASLGQVRAHEVTAAPLKVSTLVASSITQPCCPTRSRCPPGRDHLPPAKMVFMGTEE